MKVYVQAKDGVPMDYDHFNAACGFKEMGFEVIYCSSLEALKESERGDVIVGYIGVVNSRLLDFDTHIEDVDYPQCLKEFLQRRMWESTINEVSSLPESWPVFVKPKKNKKFSGRVIRSTSDLVGCGSCYDNAAVVCSEVLDIVSEYRVFVRYGKILDVRRYKGDWRILPDPSVIECCVERYKEAPAGYAIDFGVTEEGKTVLVEVNNTCSIGSYGLDSVLYAKLIAARWAELVGVEDECRF